MSLANFIVYTPQDVQRLHFLRTLIFVFIIAFVLNAVWEHFHSLLYIHYKGEEITNFILIRAALFDAGIITLFAVFFLKFRALQKQLWIMFALLVFFAVGLEMWALETSRWAYTEYMPIVPILNVGITPTIQLGLLAFISVYLGKKLS